MWPVEGIETLDDVVALAVLGAWLGTAVLGATLLIRGGAYRLLLGLQRNDQRLPLRRSTVMLFHVCLAGTGAGLWVVAVLSGRLMALYGACAVLIPTAVTGLAVFSRWLPATGRHSRPGTDGRRVPSVVALAHFTGAALTILWALTALALVLDRRF